MVRFKVNYGAHIARNFAYLDYDRMKYILHDHEDITKAAATAAAEEQASPKPKAKRLSESFTKSTAKLLDHHEHNVDFSRVFYEEITRVDDCFVVHMNELDYVFVDIQRLATEFEEKSKTMPKAQKKAQEAALKRNLTILHNKLARLDTYRMLNRTAAIKILKKHDKLAKSLGEPKVLDSHMERVDKTSFGDGGKIRAMQAQLERLYAELFCSGIMEEAQGKLRLAKTLTNPTVVLAVTFKVGVICTLLAWLVNNLVSTPQISLLYMQMQDPAVYVYAAVAALIIYRWFWGFSVFMWDSVDIDYILILDLDANKHMPRSEQIFSDAATLTILYLINVLLFHSMRWHYQYSHEKESVYSQNRLSEFLEHMSEHAYIMPVLLIVCTALLVFKAALGSASCGVFSTKIFIRVRNNVALTFFFVKSFLVIYFNMMNVYVFSYEVFFLCDQLFKAPFEPVHLRHSYAADILCSFVKVFAAGLFGTCYFTSGSYLYASDLSDPRGTERFATCTNNDFLLFVKVMIYIYPYYIRLMQCLRQQRDHYVRKHKTVPISTQGTEPESQVGTSRGQVFIDVDAIVDQTEHELGIDSNVFIYTDIDTDAETCATRGEGGSSRGGGGRNGGRIGGGGGDDDIEKGGYVNVACSPMRTNQEEQGKTSTVNNGSRVMTGYQQQLNNGEVDLLGLYSNDADLNSGSSADSSGVSTPLDTSSTTTKHTVNNGAYVRVPSAAYRAPESAMNKKKSKPKKAHIRFMDNVVDFDTPTSGHAVDRHFTDIPHVHVDADEENGLDTDDDHAQDQERPRDVSAAGQQSSTFTTSPMHALFGTATDDLPASSPNSSGGGGGGGSGVHKRGTCGVSFGAQPTKSSKNSEEEIRNAIELVRSPLHSSSSATATTKAKDKTIAHKGTTSTSGTRGIFVKPGTTPAKKRFSLSRSESFELIAPSIAVELSKLLPKSLRDRIGEVIVWPYSYNAFRYFLSILVIIFGSYPPQDPTSPEFMGWYYTLYVVSTLYNCYWDVFQDFQLLQFNCERPLLRNKLFYEEQSYFYYIVLVLNPILRFLWTASFTPYGSHEFMILFEIIRRSLWACLRMEVGYIQELARRK